MKTLMYLVCLLCSTGVIAQTATWQQVTTSTNKDLNCIVFPSPQVGYIGGSDSLLLKTIDGGLTWNPVSYTGINFVPGGDHFMELDFITDEIGFATVGPYTGTYRTADGGLTWNSLDLNMCYNHGLYFFADGEGFVGGSGCFQGEQIAKFSLGNATPVYATINSPSWISDDLILDIDFDLGTFGSSGLAVSAGGRILRTTNSGASWDTIASPLGNQVPLTTVSIVNSNLAYIAYNNGGGVNGLLKSIDGGLTWSFELNTASFYYPSFYDLHTTTLGTTYTGASYTGGSTSNYGLIMESVDNNIWNMYPVDEPIYSMTSYNDTIIWGAGKNGYLVRKGRVSPLATNNLERPNSISIFPNPTSEAFTLQVPEEFKNEIFNVEIYSLDGKLVQATQTGANAISVSALNNGNYILRVTCNTMVWTSKLVKP